MHCEACGNAINKSTDRWYQLMTAWVRGGRLSGSRRAGRLEQRFACGSCVDAMARSGSSWQQPSLFEGEA